MIERGNSWRIGGIAKTAKIAKDCQFQNQAALRFAGPCCARLGNAKESKKSTGKSGKANEGTEQAGKAPTGQAKSANAAFAVTREHPFMELLRGRAPDEKPQVAGWRR
jgi:hypothetical protein